MARGPHKGSAERGMSMVELMVAITISLVLLAGIIQLFVSNKVTYETTDDLSRLQENARFAIEAITRDLRMAGFFGCSDNRSEVANQLDVATPGVLHDVSNPIEGLDNAASGDTWRPSANTALVNPFPAGAPNTGDIWANTDAIVVRYLDGATAVDVAAPMTGTSAVVTLTPPAGGLTVAQGNLVGVADCASADIFQVTNADPVADQALAHQVGAGTPRNANATLTRVYDVGSRAMFLVTNRYYIGTGAYGGPSLFRQGLDASGAPVAQELVEGIENMQILYGVDTSIPRDGTPDTYSTADAVGAANWPNVVAVRIALLASTVDELGNIPDTATYALLDTNYDPVDDRRQRRVFSTTVLMRNLQ